MSAAPFDKLADRYDALWTRSLVGRCQREAVWRWLDPLIKPRHEILDLGCGTGEDALHFSKLGVQVQAIDASTDMVRIARSRGVNARSLRLERLDTMNGIFDGAISNFGVLNCVQNLEGVSRALSRLIHRGGFLALCLMGRCCIWEIGHFLRRFDFHNAFRRWKRTGCSTSIGIQVNYPSIHRLINVFRPAFQLVRWIGIGLCVPPSYVDRLPRKAVSWLARMDRRLAHRRGLRALADHRLLLFKRL
jgi:ubiquinone/menaquinone biosynthesis C-methylase UbiE